MTINETLPKILEDIERLEPFPAAAIRLLEMSINEAPPYEMSLVIERDPGLTAKVLRLANSALYAAKVEVCSIQDACARLGTDVVASLAMSAGCSSFFMRSGNRPSGSNDDLWLECLYVASFARHLARWSRRPIEELTYTIGLLQNVGHIVLDRYMVAAQDEILARVDEGFDVLSAERQVLGMDHAMLGSRLAKKWELPFPLVVGIRAHHAPALAGGHRVLCEFLSVAEELAILELHRSGRSMLRRPDGRSARIPGLSRKALAELRATVEAEVEATRTVMQ